MTELEVSKLLTLASAIDNREVTMPKVKAWHAVIGHLEYEACVKALHQHQRTSSEYLMPAHIVQLVTPKPHPDDWMNR